MKQSKKLTQSELVKVIQAVEVLDLDRAEDKALMALALEECAYIDHGNDQNKVKQNTWDMLATVPDIMMYMSSPKSKRKTDPDCLHVKIYDGIVLKSLVNGMRRVTDGVTGKRVSWLLDTDPSELSAVQKTRRKHHQQRMKGSYVGNWRTNIRGRLEKAEKKRAPRNEEKATKATKAPAKVTKAHVKQLNTALTEMKLTEAQVIALFKTKLEGMGLTKIGVATGELQSALDRLAHIAGDIVKHNKAAIKETA
jgi:hypothetical protein